MYQWRRPFVGANNVFVMETNRFLSVSSSTVGYDSRCPGSRRTRHLSLRVPYALSRIEKHNYYKQLRSRCVRKNGLLRVLSYKWSVLLYKDRLRLPYTLIYIHSKHFFPRMLILRLKGMQTLAIASLKARQAKWKFPSTYNVAMT